jgi:hypothetical protein
MVARLLDETELPPRPGPFDQSFRSLPKFSPLVEEIRQRESCRSTAPPPKRSYKSKERLRLIEAHVSDLLAVTTVPPKRRPLELRRLLLD